MLCDECQFSKNFTEHGLKCHKAQRHKKKYIKEAD